MKSMTRRLMIASGATAAMLATFALFDAVVAQDSTSDPTAKPSLQRYPVTMKRAAANFYGVLDSDEPLQADQLHEQRTRELLEKYDATSVDSEKAKVVDELTATVTEHFDVRQEIREKELKQLEEQLKKLRALHERRAQEKSDIVKDRVRQLLRDADGLGWGGEGHPGGSLQRSATYYQAK